MSFTQLYFVMFFVKKLSCRRDRAMLRDIEYFDKSFKLTQGHSKRHLSTAYVNPC